MAQRAILGRRGSAYGLWASKPGVNVETTSLAGMQFSSDCSAFDFITSGTWSASWPAGSQTAQELDQTISFGRTFPSPPLVVFERLSAGAYHPIGGPGGLSIYYMADIYEEMWPADPEFRGTGFYALQAEPTTTGLRVRASYDRVVPNQQPKPELGFRYSVYSYNV